MSKAQIEAQIIEHQQLVAEMLRLLVDDIAQLASTCAQALEAGHKIILFGNGGSAADAQHIAAELSGRFERDRRALAALAITTDTSALTAIGNDLGFENIFARQVEALAKPGDVLIGLSTSGKSLNVHRAFEVGKAMQCKCIALTGGNGGALVGLCHQSIVVPSQNTARIQEMHILIGHLVCRVIEASVC